jgi:hypothetical protein
MHQNEKRKIELKRKVKIKASEKKYKKYKQFLEILKN